MNPKVDFYFSKGKWQVETSELRKVILDCGLTEELKWGVPCYTLKGANVILIHNFKEYTAVLFHKGVLLKDTENILIQQTENVQSARQIRFTTLQEIIDIEKVLKAYVFEAIEVEKAGLKVELKKTKDYDVPEELQVKLDENQALKEAFENLTPGRQRAYFYNISQAKQSKTREARVEKYIPKILEGNGIDD
jgi:uncharacterized protein YdeI (YjbR/CyaY-like superfamily)